MENSWWKLIVVDDDFELDDIDREHIAKCIIAGFNEGQLIHEIDEDNTNI